MRTVGSYAMLLSPLIVVLGVSTVNFRAAGWILIGVAWPFLLFWLLRIAEPVLANWIFDRPILRG